MLNKYIRLLKQQKKKNIIIGSIILIVLIVNIFIVKIEKLEAVHYVVGESNDIQEINIPEGYELHELLVEDGESVKQDQELLLLKNKEVESNTEKLTLIKQYLNGSISAEDENEISLEIEEIESQRVQIENDNNVVNNQVSNNNDKIRHLQEYEKAINNRELLANNHPYSADYKNYKFLIENKTDKEIEIIKNEIKISITNQIQELEDVNIELELTKKDSLQTLTDLYVTRYASAGNNDNQVYKVIHTKMAGKVKLITSSNKDIYMQVIPDNTKISIYVTPNQVHILNDEGYLTTIDDERHEFKIDYQSKVYDKENNIYIYEIQTEEVDLDIGSNGEAYITKDKVNLFDLIKSYIFEKEEKGNEIRN